MPGVDFVYLSGTSQANPLEGSVTFGAGSEFADITVLPIADQDDEGQETLRIALVDRSNDYKLGSPAAASIAVRDGIDMTLPAVTIGRTVNELQEIILPIAAGGTWRIGFGPANTLPIPYGAMNSEVQAALEALSSIGAGNVAVTGTGMPADPYKVEFVGTLGAVNVPSLSVNLTELTSIAPPVGTVTVKTDGLNGVNELFDITIETPDPEGHLQTGVGRFRIYWGPANPSLESPEPDPRASELVLWSASTEDIAAAINAIPNIVAAQGFVAVTEVEASDTRRRLRVEFLGGLSNRNLNSTNLVADAADPILDDLANVGVVYGNTAQDGVARSHKRGSDRTA